MAGTARGPVESLERAIRDYARSDARRWVDVLASSSDAGGLGETEARALMRKLLDQRWFDSARILGRALRDRMDGSPRFLRQYAQALIEERDLAEALELLESLDARPNLSVTDRSEVRGLIGRTFKQVHIDGRRLDSGSDQPPLERSIRTYLGEYRVDPEANTWHGINAAALLALARRDGRSEQTLGDPIELARSIAGDLQAKPKRELWDLATLVEAAVAVGDFESASRYARDYAWHTDVRPFYLGSTVRQFTEVWGLDSAEDSLGRDIVTLLRARQLELELGTVDVSPIERRAALAAQNRARLERVFAGRFMSLDNYRLGLQRCEPVARIGPDAGHGSGTGFVLHGSDLSPKFGDAWVLVTNQHVVDPKGKEGALPQDVGVYFHALDGVRDDEEFCIQQVLWTSPPDELDCTIATLDRPIPLKYRYPVARRLPVRGGDAVVYVVGHPSGGPLSFSLLDSAFLDHDDRLMHYRTGTEGGNSGSPVFNSDWNLVGLHHSGGDALPRLRGEAGTHQANEGISILAIRDAINA